MFFKKAENTDNLEINIGYQFGTAYFPLEIIQINKIIETVETTDWEKVEEKTTIPKEEAPKKYYEKETFIIGFSH